MQKAAKFVGTLLVSATLSLPVMAQDEPGVETVIATVNGTDITLGHLIIARATLPEQYASLPDEVLFNGILDQLIQQAALADTYDGEVPNRVSLSLENERRSLIAGEVLDGIMATAVSDEALKAAYEEQYANAETETEYNASHILVETEEEAQAIKEELEGGADFATLAREKSTGPSGPGGGSLGWFGKGMMVPTFEQAVMALEPGGISDPVQTQFGWHIVKLNETRASAAPDLESVREELELQIRQVAVQQTIERVTEAADVDRSAAEGIDPTLINNLDWLE